MKALIDQSCGLGDILFLLRAARIISEQPNVERVIFPVIPPLHYIKDKLVSSAEFVLPDDPCFSQSLLSCGQNGPVCRDEWIYLPCQYASRTISGCVIRAKYKMLGLDITGWQEDLIFHRDFEKEKELEDLLQLPKEYNFVNRNFGTGGTHVKWEVQAKNDLPVIQMRYLDGFNLFDWAGVMEKAANIYTVDTSLLLICEKLKLQAENLEMWARWGTYESIDELFNKKWNYN